MDIRNIIDAIRNSRVRVTDHVNEGAYDDNLTYEEIYLSVVQGEVIEDYPNDKPYPGCLILGSNFSGEASHSVWAHNTGKPMGGIDQVYRPAAELWVDWRVRVKK